MKYSFQNVNTLNLDKLRVLIPSLAESQAIFLSEINNPNFSVPHDQKFQYHSSPITPRIAVMACNTFNIEPVGPGLTLCQNRLRKDQTSAELEPHRLTTANRGAVGGFNRNRERKSKPRRLARLSGLNV